MTIFFHPLLRRVRLAQRRLERAARLLMRSCHGDASELPALCGKEAALPSLLKLQQMQLKWIELEVDLLAKAELPADDAAADGALDREIIESEFRRWRERLERQAALPDE